MKLIDILLSKESEGWTWPENSIKCLQDHDCEVRFFDHKGFNHSMSFLSTILSDKYRNFGVSSEDLSHDYFVTREQYEAALAASKVPVWDGEGMPPIGCEVEVYHHPNYGIPEYSAAPGTQAKVVSHQTTTDGNDVAVIYWDENGGGKSGVFVADCLRTIRTAAERKRDRAVEEMFHAMPPGKSPGVDIREIIYDAIAAGKITGIKLED